MTDRAKEEAAFKSELANTIKAMSPKDQIATLARNILLDRNPDLNKITVAITALVKSGFAGGMNSMIVPSTKSPNERYKDWLTKSPPRLITTTNPETMQ